MNLTHSITDASIVECALNGIALLALLKQQTLRKLFPAMIIYFLFRLTSDIALFSITHVHHLFAPAVMYNLYFFIYWLSFAACSVALFLAMREAFDHLMEPLPGLRKIGRIVFSWIAIISMIVVAATALHPYGFSMRAVPLAMCELMRCVSMLELCLLAFLALSVHKLGLSYRSHVFGLGLGLGILAATDFVVSVMTTRVGSSMVSSLSLFGELGTIGAFLLWTTYFLVSEPARRSLMIPAHSQLLRWNEIALAIGQTGGQTVLTPAPKAFFLDEVEKTVDRVLSRNSIDAG